MKNYSVKIVACKTRLFKNAVSPVTKEEALKIAQAKGITQKYVNEYFNAKPKDLQVIHVFQKPYAFKIVSL